jgi:Zn finger protein HypA/HybF involved in hydrogenase expression
MTMDAKRDRPATNPGGMQCENCDEIFIGEEWHSYCAICQSWFDRGRETVSPSKEPHSR